MTITRRCPSCGAALNRLAGRDAQAVVIVGTQYGRIVERPTLATIYSCPTCEHTQAGGVIISESSRRPRKGVKP